MLAQVHYLKYSTLLHSIEYDALDFKNYLEPSLNNPIQLC